MTTHAAQLSSSILLGTVILLSSTVGSRADAQTPACTLIPAAEAAQILGKPAAAKAQTVTNDEQDCGYMGLPFDLHTEVLKSPSGWSAAMKEQIKKGKAEAVNGIGDEAAFTKDGNGDYVLVSRKANRIVTVTIYASEGTADALKPKLIKMATAAVARVK
jgi:hypothetical protein